MNPEKVMIAETEKAQLKVMLIEQIQLIRNMLDNLELKLRNNETLHASEGLQGNGVYLDSLVAQIAIYEKMLDRIK